MGHTRGPGVARAVLLVALCPSAPGDAAPAGPGLVVVALDTSASLAGADVAKGRDLAAATVGALPPRSEVIVLTFDDHVRLAVARTSDGRRLRQGLAAAAPRGRHTVLHDALYDAVRALQKAGPGPRAVLLLTDGRDDRSALLLDDGLRLAIEEGIPVHAVGLGRVHTRALRRIATLTGGTYSPSAKATPSGVAAQISASLAGAAAAGGGAFPSTAAGATSNRAREVATGFVLLLLAAVIAALALGRRAAPPPAPVLAPARSPAPPRALLPAYLLSPTVVARLGAATQEYLEDTARLEERPVLCVLRGPEAGQVFELSTASATSVGRARANDVRLHDLAVSAEHCRIQLQDGRFVLHDLRSRNGTYVNQRRVAHHVLAQGDLITVGETQAAFRTDLRRDGAEAATPGSSPGAPSART